MIKEFGPSCQISYQWYNSVIPNADSKNEIDRVFTMVEENFEIQPTQMLEIDSKNRIPPNYDFPPSRQNKNEK